METVPTSAINMKKQNSDSINETEKWDTKQSSMNFPRRWFGATVIGEKVYVAGGGNDRYLCSAEVYDCASNKWSSIPDMKKKRYGCCVTSVNGKVYAVGGRDDSRRLASCEMFDPDTNKWSAIPSMKKARTCCASCAIGDKLYVIGGYACFTSVEVYDTITQEWSILPNMTTKRGGCDAVSVGDKIYVFGGWDGTYLSSAEVYDVTTQEWTPLPDMIEKRYGCSATAVGNRIYVVGGYDGSNRYSSCEVFDTSTNTWSSPIPDMKEKRSSCQAVTIGTSIYVMGGYNGTTLHSSVEVFETSTSTSSEQIGSRKRSHSQIAQRRNEEPSHADTGDHEPPIGHVNRSSQCSIIHNDHPTYTFSRTVRDRLIFLEDKSGFKHDSSEILIRRIEYLEMNIFGEIKDIGEPISRRMKSLETAFFDDDSVS